MVSDVNLHPYIKWTVRMQANEELLSQAHKDKLAALRARLAALGDTAGYVRLPAHALLQQCPEGTSDAACGAMTPMRHVFSVVVVNKKGHVVPASGPKETDINAQKAECDVALHNSASGRDAQPALVIGRHYITERDSAPVQYNGIL